MAVYYRRDFLGLLSAVVLGLLILLTPSTMLVHPWFLDTYAFAAEAVYVVRNGHIGTFHHLLENPTLGLTFGPLLMITGIDPFVLQKIYPGFFAIIFTVLLYITAKKIKIDNESLVVAPLLFVSIAWPNELHLCRLSLSLVYYLASCLLLLHLIFQRSDRRIFVLLVLQVLILTMSHPATPLFFIANLATIFFLGRVWPKFRPKEFRVIIQTLLISAVAWILWNTLMPSVAISSLASLFQNVVKSLTENRYEFFHGATIFQAYSPIYGLVINIRFALTLAIFILMILLLFAMYHYLRDRKVLVVLTGWIMGNMLGTGLLVCFGQGYSAITKPTILNFVSWAPLGALVFSILSSKSGIYVKIKRVAKCVFVVALIIVPLLLIPIIKYGSLPLLYPTSKELAHKEFLDLHWAGGKLIYFEGNLPYGYSYILHGVGELEYATYVFDYGGVDSILASGSSLWITYRVVTRDGFFNYNSSMLSLVENLTLYQSTYNVVYDSGWPESILIPRTRS
jgi:hypothetical protein